ncbi:Uncharacterised protein [Fusobacterium varium]|nr:hypothetical protein [Fusobacterium varium]VEH39283.1 Uncharacterised protein [Fusobacterium varium]
MQIDICGEQTISQYNFVFENNSSASSDNFELEVAIPSTLREEDLFEAVVRIKEITDREFPDRELNIAVTIEGKNHHEDEKMLKINNKINKIIAADKKIFILFSIIL